MREAADRARWNQTASILAALANTVRDPKTRNSPYLMREFHPYLVQESKKRKADKAATKFDISILKSVFVDNLSMDEIEDKHGV